MNPLNQILTISQVLTKKFEGILDPKEKVKINSTLLKQMKGMAEMVWASGKYLEFMANS